MLELICTKYSTEFYKNILSFYLRKPYFAEVVLKNRFFRKLFNFKKIIMTETTKTKFMTMISRMLF